MWLLWASDALPNRRKNGCPKGQPYLKAYDIAVVMSSIRDAGLIAKVRDNSISGLSYKYVWATKS